MNMAEFSDRVKKIGYETVSSCFYTDVFYKDNLVATFRWMERSFILRPNFYGVSKVKQDKLFHLLWESAKEGG